MEHGRSILNKKNSRKVTKEKIKKIVDDDDDDNGDHYDDAGGTMAGWKWPLVVDGQGEVVQGISNDV